MVSLVRSAARAHRIEHVGRLFHLRLDGLEHRELLEVAVVGALVLRIEAGRYELKAASLDKCVEILNGLSSSLDEESGGEVVANLGRLYDYCAHRLYAVGLQLDTSIIDEVSGLLTTLRSGWVGVQERA